METNTPQQKNNGLTGKQWIIIISIICLTILISVLLWIHHKRSKLSKYLKLMNKLGNMYKTACKEPFNFPLCDGQWDSPACSTIKKARDSICGVPSKIITQQNKILDTLTKK